MTASIESLHDCYCEGCNKPASIPSGDYWLCEVCAKDAAEEQERRDKRAAQARARRQLAKWNKSIAATKAAVAEYRKDFP